MCCSEGSLYRTARPIAISPVLKRRLGHKDSYPNLQSQLESDTEAAKTNKDNDTGERKMTTGRVSWARSITKRNGRHRGTLEGCSVTKAVLSTEGRVTIDSKEGERPWPVDPSQRQVYTGVESGGLADLPWTASVVAP